MKWRRTPSTWTGAAAVSAARPASVSTASVTRRSAALGAGSATRPSRTRPSRRRVRPLGDKCSRVARTQHIRKLPLRRLGEVHEHGVVALAEPEPLDRSSASNEAWTSAYTSTRPRQARISSSSSHSTTASLMTDRLPASRRGQ